MFPFLSVVPRTAPFLLPIHSKTIRKTVGGKCLSHRGCINSTRTRVVCLSCIYLLVADWWWHRGRHNLLNTYLGKRGTIFFTTPPTPTTHLFYWKMYIQYTCWTHPSGGLADTFAQSAVLGLSKDRSERWLSTNNILQAGRFGNRVEVLAGSPRS